MGIGTLFGIDVPIVQAPMAGVQDHRLAAAVSNAGGLGSLPCALLTPEEMRAALAALRAATDRPFNVNFFAHTAPNPMNEGERLARWRRALDRYYTEWGIQDGPPTPSLGGRRPFDAAAVDVLREFAPSVVSFHFGLPPAPLLEPIRRWGGKIISTATTVEEALWLQERGVDAIIAQGAEAGGHRGMFLTTDVTTQMGTLALVRQVAAAVDVPIIAAGGIADGPGVQAALALGAAGVQVGTAYLLCPEATTKPWHRAALQSPGAQHTAITNVFTGRPARGIVNRLVRELGPLHPDAPAFPLAAGALAPLRAEAEKVDNTDFSPLWAGQNVSGCRPAPAAELTRRLAEGLV